ncbi:PREDICTED: uncharacterized protein LOC105367971 [Ceratosolen solmsi marchali]|uniref:Uncharacterized protein LOC105367971 n=1 Tax=Ceratosolen solmsi marchali TaxID=326594 RepID=A0AAJ7E283_9HYME|nr:PREDICTED: uncharacterized protein LOC105367971 [Ceratosolen solmsi marchali]XP_011505149.1 PREDICTED: uncharacterized protein LOC105367971 [Ceratosolen solmsi marchali]
MYKYITLALLVASALAVPTDKSESVAERLDCFQNEDDMFSCMAVKLVSSIERAARSADLNIVDGITFIRDTPLERSGKSLKPEKEVLSELPREAADRTLELATMLYESAVSFFKSHSLKVNIPEGSMSRALVEGRAKIKKMILPLIAAAGIKIFALVPILVGGLALLIVKALFVGKIALLIAGILAFQRLFSSSAGSIGSGFSSFGSNIFNKNPQGSWYDGNQGWSGASANQGQGYYRSFSDKVDAQSMAYAGQVPSANEAN